jgi:AbiU2
MNGFDKISKLSISERIAAAKAKTERVVDHLLYVLELHENNEIIVYSPTLRSQIPTSYAANAFIVFRHGLHQFEIVRLCALWDSVELEKENIPTIIKLIDHPEVIEALAQETAAHWKGQEGGILNRSDDPELSVLEVDALRLSNDEFGNQQAQRAREELRESIHNSRAILAAPKLASIMNLRDKYLAHSLTETRRERKVGAIDPMKYGDEREILNASLPIVQALFCWVNGKSFNFENSREIDRKNAKALWEACTFDIKR